MGIIGPYHEDQPAQSRPIRKALVTPGSPGTAGLHPQAPRPGGNSSLVEEWADPTDIYPCRDLPRAQCTSEALCILNHGPGNIAHVVVLRCQCPGRRVPPDPRHSCFAGENIRHIQKVNKYSHFNQCLNKSFNQCPVCIFKKNLLNQYPGCIPKPIPSFACTGRCTSYVQVTLKLTFASDAISGLFGGRVAILSPNWHLHFPHWHTILGLFGEIPRITHWLRYPAAKYGRRSAAVCVVRSPRLSSCSFTVCCPYCSLNLLAVCVVRSRRLSLSSYILLLFVVN